MLGTVLFGSTAYAQNDAATDLSMKILPSLVKIVSICGNNEARVATGFVWGPHGSVVTDLHVVAGCPPPYTVLYFQTNGSKLTQIARDATVESRSACRGSCAVDRHQSAGRAAVAGSLPRP